MPALAVHSPPISPPNSTTPGTMRWTQWTGKETEPQVNELGGRNGRAGVGLLIRRFAIPASGVDEDRGKRNAGDA